MSDPTVSRAPIDPNVITSIRLPLAPLVVLALYTETLWGVVLAAVLALALEMTDLADGWVARKYGAVTDFGKLYDPFSDAFTRYTLFLGLYAVHVADLWMVIAIFWRDASVSFFRQVAATRNVVMSARQSGKIKAVVQGVGTQIVFIALVVGKVAPTQAEHAGQVAWGTMLIVTLVTTWSFVDYFVGHFALLRDAWTNRPVKREP